MTQVGKLLKGPLAFTIPLIAVAMVAVIGIGIGLLFIEVTHASNGDVALITAVVLTAVIMAVAALLSYRDYKNPQAAETRTGGPSPRPTGESQAGPRAPVTTRPVRGRSRSDGRRKSR
ncbi:MAG TPA: hypothetical protein VFV93_13280 [Thermomicrobiales bacterium]|nr:hypothetical protein [Thermomicrobiales bacterium]